MSTPSILPPDEQTANLPTEQLLANLSSASPYLRGRVLAGLGPRLPGSPHLFPLLVEAIKAPENRRDVFFGFIKVAWLGVIAVLENGTPAQVDLINRLVKTWEATEQKDLRHHLNGSGLPFNLN